MQLLILHYTVFNSLSNKSAVFSLNDNCCVVSTPILMRCFKKLILQDIQPNIPASPTSMRLELKDPKRMPYALHSVFANLENKNSYIRML